jgi:hypothetical protein
MHIMDKIVEFDSRLKRSNNHEKIIDKCISFCRRTYESDMWDDVTGLDCSDIEKGKQNNALARRLFETGPENSFCLNNVLDEEATPAINIWKAKVDDVQKKRTIDFVDALNEGFILSDLSGWEIEN